MRPPGQRLLQPTPPVAEQDVDACPAALGERRHVAEGLRHRVHEEEALRARDEAAVVLQRGRTQELDAAQPIVRVQRRSLPRRIARKHDHEVRLGHLLGVLLHHLAPLRESRRQALAWRTGEDEPPRHALGGPSRVEDGVDALGPHAGDGAPEAVKLPLRHPHEQGRARGEQLAVRLVEIAHDVRGAHDDPVCVDVVGRYRPALDVERVRPQARTQREGDVLDAVALHR